MAHTLKHITTSARQARDNAHRAYTEALSTKQSNVVLVGRIIGGEWTTRGLHNFCEYCEKYMHNMGWDCPHCGKETL